MGIIPVCKLVYSCVSAGITYINDNSNIKKLISIIKSEVIHEKELG